MSLIRRITHAGIHPDMSIEFAKRITMSNWICIIGMANDIFFLAVMILLEKPLIVYTLCLQVLLNLGIVALNSIRRYDLSRFIIIPIYCVSNTYMDYLFIELESIRLFLYPVAFLGFLYYGPNEKRKAIYGSLFALACLMLITAMTSGKQVGVYHLTPAALLFMDLSLVAASLVTTVGLVAAFFVETMRSETRLRREREKLAYIFDQVEEAVLLSDSQGCVQPEYSKYTEELLDLRKQDIQGQNIIDVIFGKSRNPTDDINQCKAALDFSIGNDEVTWQINQDSLIRSAKIETRAGTRDLHVNWQPIYNGDVIKGVLTVIRDETLEKKQIELERMVKEGHSLMFDVVNAVFQSSVYHVTEFLQNIVEKIRVNDVNHLSKFKLDLHTLKGAARTLQLKSIALCLHHLEEDVIWVEQRKLDSQTMLENVENLKKKVVSCQEIISSIYQSGQRSLVFPQNLFGLMAELMGSTVTQIEENKLRLGHIEVQDGVREWPSQLHMAIKEILLHAITNSIDHGFAIPWREGQFTQKPVTLSVSSKQEGGFLKIRYFDDGAGVSQEKLDFFLKKAGPAATGLASSYDVLTLEGISSAKTVNMTSGRGIGMAAIKNIVQSLNGSLQISKAISGGLQLDISLPIHNASLLRAM
nr:Histidine kinase-, DNA gyrase B-, and HSP90-like ATPase [uncultured bacterium]